MRTTAALLGILLAASPATAPADERISELIERGLAPVRTERVHERIWLAVGNSNAYRIVTHEGSVIFDTGLYPQAVEQKAALEAVAPGPVRYAILSHSHGDHTGGAELWREAGAELVAHRLFLQRAADRERLTGFDTRRDSILWGPMLETTERYKAVEPDVIVDERWGFELGGLSFEVLHMTAGEGPDGIALWIPEIRALFVGDMFGAILGDEGAFPNLFTLRGENLREAQPLHRHAGAGAGAGARVDSARSFRPGGRRRADPGGRRAGARRDALRARRDRGRHERRPLALGADARG